MHTVVRMAVLLTLIAGATAFSTAQTSAELQAYFKESGGLSQDQIAAIQSGQPVAKTLTSRTPAEIFVLGVIYINAAPESYLKFASLPAPWNNCINPSIGLRPTRMTR